MAIIKQKSAKPEAKERTIGELAQEAFSYTYRNGEKLLGLRELSNGDTLTLDAEDRQAVRDTFADIYRVLTVIFLEPMAVKPEAPAEEQPEKPKK